MKILRRIGILFVLLVAAVPVMFAMMSLFSSRPTNLGVTDGRLADCPDKPNSVSTQSDDPRHKIDPIFYSGSADDALTRLRKVLGDQPRTTVITDDGNYIHAEARSLVFRFVDDLEFFLDEKQSVIHFRSASRVGHSDMGVNRKRAEAIRSAFEGIQGRVETGGTG